MSSRRGRLTPHPVVAQLRAAREAAGHSRPRVARDHGIPLRTLEAWEWGLASPTLDVLAPYARALGYDITLTPRQEEQWAAPDSPATPAASSPAPADADASTATKAGAS